MSRSHEASSSTGTQQVLTGVEAAAAGLWPIAKGLVEQARGSDHVVREVGGLCVQRAEVDCLRRGADQTPEALKITLDTMDGSVEIVLKDLAAPEVLEIVEAPYGHGYAHPQPVKDPADQIDRLREAESALKPSESLAS